MKKVYKKNQLLEVNNIPSEVIESSEGVDWTSSLFLLSSDFAIVVVCTEELSKFLLE